ncbi:MAG: hypothetical protein Q8P41_32135 [Pseudomonadota bacterium]|nr:hypothetical protein [Pseudomonadota bacterium]
MTPEVGVDADESAPISEDELVAARARQMRAELDLLGKPAPTLSVSRWIQGTGNLGSAKVTLLVFFEAEDSDRDALAIVEALWRRHRDAGLAVIGLTRESDLHPAPTISAWLRRVAITFPVGLDAEGATAEAWRRSSTLSGALVREGRVAWTGNPARVTDALLADHL